LFPVIQEWIATLDDLPSAPGTMDAERIYVPIQPEKIVALSRKTGAKLWARDIESNWPPVVIGDVLYVIASAEIHALDAASGSEKGRVPFDAKVTAPLTAAIGIRSSTSSGRPELVEGRDPESAIRSVDLLIATFEKGRIIAFATDNGRMLWMRELGG